MKNTDLLEISQLLRVIRDEIKTINKHNNTVEFFLGAILGVLIAISLKI